MDSSFFSQQMPYCLATLLVYMALCITTLNDLNILVILLLLNNIGGQLQDLPRTISEGSIKELQKATVQKMT